MILLLLDRITITEEDLRLATAKTLVNMILPSAISMAVEAGS